MSDFDCCACLCVGICSLFCSTCGSPGGSYICMPCCRRGHSDDYSFDDDRSLDMSTSGRGDAEPAQIMRPEPALIVQPSKTRQMNPHLAHIGADPTH